MNDTSQQPNLARVIFMACALAEADAAGDSVARCLAERVIIARAAEARQELLDLLEAHAALQAAIHAAGYRVKPPPRPKGWVDGDRENFPQENIGEDA